MNLTSDNTPFVRDDIAREIVVAPPGCGFPENVVTPLSILSRREGERTRAYITRIGLSGCKCAIRIQSDYLEERKRIDPEGKEYYHEQLVCLHDAARDGYEF